MKISVCGDGEVDPPEECDDGNADAGDGCDANCQTEPETGACCVSDTCLDNLSFDDCGAQGGVFQGDNTSCSDLDCDEPDPEGACCLPLPGGGCSDGLVEEDCTQLGGDYKGDGSTCADADVVCAISVPVVAACCLDGECSETTAAECDTEGGLFLGIGFTCENAACLISVPVGGACCLDESCSETTEGFCDDVGGVFQGNGTTCADAICDEGGGSIPPIPEPSTLVMLALAFVAMIVYGWYRRRQTTQE